MVAGPSSNSVDAISTLQFRIEPTGCHSRCFDVHWQVPADLPFLQGHFPGLPVLPAVATLESSLQMLRRALGDTPLVLQRISSAKFMQPISPGQHVRIHLQAGTQPGQWLAEWRADERRSDDDATNDAQSASTLLASVGFDAGLVGG